MNKEIEKAQMKANEIRRGNLFYPINRNVPNNIPHLLVEIPFKIAYFKNFNIVVACQLNENIVSIENPANYKFNDMSPIPSTEQWLLKFGFETDRYTFWKNGNKKIQIGFFKDGFFLIWKGSLQDRFGKKLEYIHQIQNAWFELTGEELTGEELTIKENGTDNM